MSGIVNEDQGLLAAEFVLGTLDADERARAHELLGRDQPFAELVSLWERRLGELHLMVEPVEPNLDTWYRIRQRVLGVPAPVAEPAPIEASPRVEASESVPVPAAADQPSQPQPEIGETKEPEQPPHVEVAEGAPATAEADPGGVPFAAVEAALQAAARRAEPAAGAPLADEPAPTPEPVLTSEPSPTPKRLVVPDLRAEREVATSRDLVATSRDLKERKHAARGGGAWGALGPLMTLVAAALAGLIVAWRYIPDRLPAQLQPAALLNTAPTPADAVKRPPRRLTSQFEE
jgi:hypothetical protein